MNLPPIPQTIDGLDGRRWETFAPYFEGLREFEPNVETIGQWLTNWSQLTQLLREIGALTYIQKSVDTTSKDKEQAFLDFIENVYPAATTADQALKEKLLQLPVTDPKMAIPLRNMKSDADLFRQENIPLLVELQKLSNEYEKITGGLKGMWDGEEKNLSQLSQFLSDNARPVRERAWQMVMALWLSVRPQLNDIYAKMLKLRCQVADNAGLADYRAYAFREKRRFEYTPEDCFTFHEAIEKVVKPAAERVLARKAANMGLTQLRPWDLEVSGDERPPLKPYQGQDELIQHSLDIFNQIDPELGRYVAIMAEEELLDLDTRPGKALGGYCSDLPVRQRPFIFMNGVGVHDDVQTLLHEAGHAFHAFESYKLPLAWQQDPPMEFCEVASMSMELLTAPYLTKENGGFYDHAEAARARIEHLEKILLFLPYMAVVDAFQHWVYTHPNEANEAANCDAAWDNLWQRLMPATDWSGFEGSRMSGWHRKPHIFDVPFYYIEYGIAQVGALQIWRNSLADHQAALTAYRQGLALGGTQSLPELFAAAGIEFRLDKVMLADLVALIEQTIAELEEQL